MPTYGPGNAMGEIVALWTSFAWSSVVAALIAGFAIGQLNVFLVSAVLHRGMCHKAIAYPNWVKRTIAVWLWVTVCTSPLEWIAAHLHHHANADTEDDPHAPAQKGFWQVLLLTWYYVPRWARANRDFARQRYLGSFKEERLLQYLDRPAVNSTNFHFQLIASVLLGPVTIAFWIARFVPYLLASGYVNSVAHTKGSRPYGDSGTDAVGLLQNIAGFLVGGEPLGHNFHHRYPGSPTFRRERFDPGFWFAVRILRGDPLARSGRTT
jgi:fatty-acid desaturase